MTFAPLHVEAAAVAGGWDPLGPVYVDDDVEIAWITADGTVTPAPAPQTAPVGAWWAIRRANAPSAPTRPTKEQAACCRAHVDELGRPPIGYCSPTCHRRPEVTR